MARHISPQRSVQRVESNTGAVHSFSESEVRAYIEYFNSNLSDDPAFKHVPMPLDPGNKARFFEVMKDGLLLVYAAHSLPRSAHSLCCAQQADQQVLPWKCRRNEDQTDS